MNKAGLVPSLQGLTVLWGQGSRGKHPCSAQSNSPQTALLDDHAVVCLTFTLIHIHGIGWFAPLWRTSASFYVSFLQSLVSGSLIGSNTMPFSPIRLAGIKNLIRRCVGKAGAHIRCWWECTLILLKRQLKDRSAFSL